MFDVDIDVHGAHEGADVFHSLGYRATHARPAMERLAREMLTENRGRLETGAAVKPLEHSTQERKARQGEDPRPLRGALRLLHGSPTRKPDALFRALTLWRDRAEGQVLSTRKDGLTFGLSSRGPTFYGRFQFDDGRDLFPAREWIARRAGDLVRDHLLDEHHNPQQYAFDL